MHKSHNRKGEVDIYVSGTAQHPTYFSSFFSSHRNNFDDFMLLKQKASKTLFICEKKSLLNKRTEKEWKCEILRLRGTWRTFS